MSDPLKPHKRAKSFTNETAVQIIEHSAEHEAAPHEEAADPYYEPYFCDDIKGYAEEGMYPEEWAAEFGVAEITMFGWAQRFPEFADAYAIAMTKLRASFTAELRRNSRLPGAMTNAVLLSKIAASRFPDLYGTPHKAPPNGRSAPGSNARDITPSQPSATGEVEDYDDHTQEHLLKELETLRNRHEIE